MDFLHALFLLILKPFFYPFFYSIWNIPWGPTHPVNPEEISRMLTTFFTFISHPGIFRVLFLLKLPYLVFDLLCAWMLFKLAGKNAFRFWMWNPVIIFVTAIYGRFETIPLFLLLLSIYLLKKERSEWAYFSLSLAILLRIYPVLLLPFFLRKEKKYLLRGLPFLILPLLLFIFIPPGKGGGIPHINYLLSMNFYLGLHSTLYIFFISYLLLLFHFFRFSSSRELPFYLALFHLLLFATSYFHLQFYAWLIPFLSLTIAGERYKENFFYFSLIFYFLYLFQWGRVNSVYLFAPLNPEKFSSLPSLQEILSPQNFHRFMGLVRSGLSACLLWLFYLMVRERNPQFSRNSSNSV